MSTTYTIPADIVPYVREATIYELGRAGHDIAEQAERIEPELQEPLKRFDALRAAVDSLPTEPNADAHVGEASVRPIVEALRGHTRSVVGMLEEAREVGRIDSADKYQAELDRIEAGLDEMLATFPSATGGDA